jgi:hypothetical protein
MNKTNDLSHFYLLLIIVLFLAFTKCSSKEETNKINTYSQVIDYPNGPMVKIPYPDLTVIDTVYINAKELNRFATDTSFNDYLNDIYVLFHFLLPDSVLIKMSKSQNLLIKLHASEQICSRADNDFISNIKKRDSILNCYCDDLIVTKFQYYSSYSERLESMCEGFCKMYKLNLDSINNNKHISKLNKKWMNEKWPNDIGFSYDPNLFEKFNIPKNIRYPYKVGSSKPYIKMLPVESEILNDLEKLKEMYYIRTTSPIN